MHADALRYFLSVSNPRTGSSYLVTALNELPGVHADYEFKWQPSYVPHDVHLVMSSDEWDCRRELSRIGDGAAVGGSKLVFDCQQHERGDVAEICRRIPTDIPIIHLTRDYFDIILSLKARGAFNLPNREPSTDGNGSKIAAALQSFGEQKRYQDLEAGRPANISRARFEETLVHLIQNDLICLALSQQAERSIRVDYTDLHDRLPEVAHFVGYKGPSEAIDAVRQNPITRKLKALSDDLIPNAAEYRRICEMVYAKVLFTCEMDIPFGEVWSEDGSINLPGLSATPSLPAH